MATLRLADFAANMAQGGARPNLFRVDLDPAGPILSGLGQKFSFLCKASAIPASTVGVIPVPFRGRILKLAGDRTYADWTITVINDMDGQYEKPLRNGAIRLTTTLTT